MYIISYTIYIIICEKNFLSSKVRYGLKDHINIKKAIYFNIVILLLQLTRFEPVHTTWKEASLPLTYNCKKKIIIIITTNK